MNTNAVLIDTVRIGGRLAVPPVHIPHPFMVGADGSPLNGRFKVGDGLGMFNWMHVATHDDSGNRLVGFVEASVPKALHGRNTVGVSLDEVRDWRSTVMERLDVEWMYPDGQAPDQVNRLDVVRDFPDVPDPGELIGAIGRSDMKGRQIRSTHEDPERDNAMTTTVRTKRSGSGTLYDKGRESGDPEYRNVVRFEARERRTQIEHFTGHNSHLAELDTNDLYLLARRRFDWAGFGVEVSTTRVAMLEILRDHDLTDSEKVNALAFVVAEDRGIDLRQYLSKQRVSRSRIASKGRRGGSTSRYRLDFDRGLVAA